MTGEMRSCIPMSRQARSLHVAAALVVSFFDQLAVELAVFHLTTALVHRLACFAASHLVRRAKCCGCQ
jgi:hypothetical protein